MADFKDELHPHESHASHATGTNGAHAKPKRRGGIVGHYKRWWWVHLIVIIIVVLVVTLPLVYVGYPHIAQNQVNKSKINVTSMSILNPTPDSFDLEMTSVLITHSSYHPTLYAWEGDLYLEGSDTPFSTLPIPKVKAHNGAVEHISTHKIINNTALFTDYVTAVIGDKTLDLRLKGRTGLKQGALPKTTVNYNKVITMAGFNGLAGLTVTNLSLLLTTQPDGANMAGIVHIPNPSVQTVQLGNMTLDLSLPSNVTGSDGATPIGTSTVNNTILYPNRINSFPMRSTTNQTLVLGLLQKHPELAGADGLPVSITGKTTVVNGVNIPWLSEPLGNNTVTINLQLGAALEAAGLGGFVGLSSSSTSSSTATSTSAAPLFPSSSSSATALFGATTTSSSESCLFICPTSSSSAALFGATSSSSAALFGATSSSSSSAAPLFGATTSSSSVADLFPSATTAAAAATSSGYVNGDPNGFS